MPRNLSRARRSRVLRAEFLEPRNLLTCANTSDTCFAAIGDLGGTNPGGPVVATLVKSWDPDFIITLGDNNYPDGEASTIDANIGQFYQEFISPYVGTYGPGATTNRFFPILGNHDWNTANAQAYFDYFTLPGNERYYKLTKGPVDFFMLDSDPREPDGRTATSIQGVWLQNQLAASTAIWKIVVLHHAPYSSGSNHGSTEAVQWPYEAWGASIVLAGHDHVYERLSVGGFPYIVNGLGGRSIYSAGTLLPESQVFYNADHGALQIQANTSTLKLDFINTSGTVVDTLTLTSQAPTVSIVERRVNAGADDAEESSTGSVSVTGDDLELVEDGAAQTVGLRFKNITIPRGATVTRAYVQFQADEVQTGTTNLVIRGQANDDVTPFTTTARSISSRPRTVASVNWAPSSWSTIGAAGSAQQTPNLAAIFNEQVNRPGWKSGNDVGLIFTGTGRRTAESYEGLAAAAPLLHLEFQAPNATPTTSGIGNVTVAEDAANTVVNLHSAFADAETPDASLVYTVTGNTNSALFSSTAINSSLGTLTLDYAANAVDTSTITVRATDTGSPALSVETSFTVRTTNVNDSPVRTAGAVANLSVAPNASATSLGLGSIGYGPGGGSDEAGQTLTYAVTAVPSASFGRVLLSDGTTVVAPGSYTLAAIQGMKFRPATGVTAGTATFSFTVTDNGTTGTTADPKQLAQSLSISIVSSTVSVDVRIAASKDDAEERPGGTTALTSADLELVYDASVNQLVGLRFVGVAIPPGATIQNAYVQFTTDVKSTTATSLTIRGQAADNPVTFTSLAGSISSRPTTTASVAWSPAAWNTVGEAGVNQRTPNLASIVQQIVDRTGWASGNALALIVTGTGKRVAKSCDISASAAPLLHIEYTTGTPLMATKVANGRPGTTLRQNHVGAIAAAAIDRLARIWGDDVAQRLDDVAIQLTDLPGRTIGLSSGRTIFLDRQAAGHGWFVDRTPADDAEFAGGRRTGGIDLLTALMHEYGHLLGLGDVHDRGSNLMRASLPSGTRRLPTEADSVGAVGAPEAVFAMLGHDAD